jgi:uncharacterized glyoxalase superfamily protein PhnB
MISRTMFVLAVPSLAVSCAYYRDMLGFDVREMGDEGWRMLVRDGCRIMAGECPDAIAPRDLGDHSYFGYLVVDDIDRYCEYITARGAEIIKPLRDEPWGMRELAVRTVDGHRIMFGQEKLVSPADGDGAVSIVDLNYFSLYIDRYDEAIAFYSNVFGSPEYSEANELVGFRMGATWLTVFRGTDGPHKGSDPRNTEFAVQVSTPSDVDRLARKLVDAGAREFSAPRDTRMYERMRFACVDDPFGVRIDVYCPLPEPQKQ